MPHETKAKKRAASRGPAVSRSAAVSRRRGLGISALHLVILAVTSLALYADAMRNDFVSDDTLQLLDNRFIRNYRYIPKLFATNVWAFRHSDISNYYRPLQMLFYMGEYYLFGFHSWIFHLANLLLNLAIVYAVYSLIRALSDKSMAFWTALLFAVQPVHVEAVVWIACLPEMLCGLAFFTAMRFYHYARSGIRPVYNHALATAIFFAGLFCKETMLVFPAVLLAYEFFYRRNSLRSIILGIRHLLPYGSALILYIGIRVRALGAFAPGFIKEPGRSSYTPWQILFSVPVLVRQYIFKLLLPIHLNYFYQFHSQDAPSFDFLISAALVVALLAAMFWLRKSLPLLAFALAWFFITLAPVLSITNIGENVFTERYLYIPSMGFCVFVAWGWLRLKELSRTRVALAAAYSSMALLLVFHAIQVVRRIPDWRSDVSLMQKTVTQSPNVQQIQSGLGVAYYQTGQLYLAIAPLERAVALNPEYYLPQLYLALTYSSMGENREAVPYLLRAYELKPQFEPPWSLFGQAYANLKQWDQAIECYRQALLLEPENPVLFTVLGEALHENGETQESIDAFREAIRLEPGSLDASINLAITLAQQGDTVQAIDLLKLALQTHPSGPHVDTAWINLGAMYLHNRDTGAAKIAYEHALEVNQDSEAARQMLESIENRGDEQRARPN